MEFLKKTDFFGQVITINYKGNLKHTSPVGGMFSIAAFTVLTYLFIDHLKILLKHERSTITNSQAVTDLRSFGEVIASDLKLDIAFAVLSGN